jgi:nicotinate-nucleotide adenylyltransferase
MTAEGTQAPAREPVIAGSVGVLGGTFDPIHLGHLAIADEVREALGLERVLFIPAGIPPHKPNRRISPTADRVAMVRLAIADNPAFELSRLEVDRPGPSFAVETLAELAREGRAQGREAELTFILSDEALAGFPEWREPARILDLARLAVVRRAFTGAAAAGRPMERIDDVWVALHLPDQAERLVFVEAPRIAISASDIRRRVASGRSVRYLVPPAVLAYIGDHRLYTDMEDRQRLTESNATHAS